VVVARTVEEPREILRLRGGRVSKIETQRKIGRHFAQDDLTGGRRFAGCLAR
jgi:hypothetical protein